MEISNSELICLAMYGFSYSGDGEFSYENEKGSLALAESFQKTKFTAYVRKSGESVIPQPVDSVEEAVKFFCESGIIQ